MKTMARCCLVLCLFLVPFQSSGAQTPQTFSLTVRFEGLIAFVPSKIDSQPVLWALLPDAHYDPEGATAADLPPCVADAGVPEPAVLRRDYPHHVAALRVRNAKIAFNGTDVTGLVPAILLQGRDLRFSTGKKIAAIPALSLLTDAKEFAAARGGAPSDFAALDKVKADYLKEDSAKAMALPFLESRALIDFGDSVNANPLTCGGSAVRYGFRRPGFPPSDCMGNMPLAEDLMVQQAGLSAPVTIELKPSSDKLTIEPESPGANVIIEVLNIMPKAIADPHYQPCSEQHQHPLAFRWYYRLLDTIPADCNAHLFHCEGQAPQGGTKCPLKGLTE